MLISVITPTLNSEKFLRECLDSVEKQTVKGASFEQIVIDSNSSDNTRKISEEYSHVRFVQAGERTACEAVNLGIGLARGRYLLFLMSDDMVLPKIFQDFLCSLREKRINGKPYIVYVISIHQRLLLKLFKLLFSYFGWNSRS